MSDGSPAILYVPGIRPKPVAADYEPALRRSLVAGIAKSDAALAEQFDARAEFRLVPWTELFYTEPMDISEDLPGLAAVCEQAVATERDRREAHSFGFYRDKVMYWAGNAFPRLTRPFATPKIRTAAHEINRYLDNLDGLAGTVRELLERELLPLLEAGRPVLLIGHSFGSVVSLDVLSEQRTITERQPVDMFMSMGSPLGLKFVNRRLHYRREGLTPPAAIRQWHNWVAVGEAAIPARSFTRVFADFREHLDSPIVEHRELWNYFRKQDVLNVHKCYGYLANRDIGAAIGQWWAKRL